MGNFPSANMAGLKMFQIVGTSLFWSPHGFLVLELGLVLVLELVFFCRLNGPKIRPSKMEYNYFIK